jgi:hypothetical protein
MNFPANVSGYGAPPVAQLLQDTTFNAKRARSGDTDGGEDSQAAAKHFHPAASLINEEEDEERCIMYDGTQSSAAVVAHVLGLSDSSDDEDDEEGYFIKAADGVQCRERVAVAVKAAVAARVLGFATAAPSEIGKKVKMCLNFDPPTPPRISIVPHGKRVQLPDDDMSSSLINDPCDAEDAHAVRVVYWNGLFEKMGALE